MGNSPSYPTVKVCTWLGLALREQSRIQTGIDSAGKEDADWNVRHFPQADRGSELGHEALDKLGLRNAYERLRVIPDIPISTFLERFRPVGPATMSRPEVYGFPGRWCAALES